ncbi:MAG: MBOAT family protein, partial [Clostridia bacterium]|nr:MBOAT family protein [Clostridia bacterium]
MVFSSLIFLFAYLCITLTLYFIVPHKGRNIVLFVVSLAFYGWGEPLYILVMLFSICVAYIFGFFIDKYRDTDQKKAKIFLAVSVILNLACLIFFKYTNFFIENLRLLPFLSDVLHPIEGLELPIGISFYTFQIMSYSIDLYRGQTGVQKNFIAFGTYVTLFPQLIAGPIVRYRDVDDQLTERVENIDKFSSGVQRFIVGLGKKVLLGDSIAAVYEYYKAAAKFEPSVLGAWMITICFTLHIYFDFSGYSDMAIGLGRMFGFEFLENFNYPYISKSITEFWRRWHISLSTWFK